LRFVAKHVEIRAPDRLLGARRALEEHYRQPLYMAHIAETANMHPVTFARAFARRFGLTPARYRLLLRLNEAARMTWSKPNMKIGEIAASVGFEDIAYFHRKFLAQFGTTPALYGRRAADGAARGPASDVTLPS
jgi:transcriptional regulator GlxA family with amidase domain